MAQFRWVQPLPDPLLRLALYEQHGLRAVVVVASPIPTNPRSAIGKITAR